MIHPVSNMSTTHAIEFIHLTSHAFTYDIVKLCILSQGSLCRNMNSAAGAFMIASPQTLIDAIATEAVKAFRVCTSGSARFQTNRTFELIIHKRLEGFSG